MLSNKLKQFLIQDKDYRQEVIRTIQMRVTIYAIGLVSIMFGLGILGLLEEWFKFDFNLVIMWYINAVVLFGVIPALVVTIRTPDIKNYFDFILQFNPFYYRIRLERHERVSDIESNDITLFEFIGQSVLIWIVLSGFCCKAVSVLAFFQIPFLILNATIIIIVLGYLFNYLWPIQNGIKIDRIKLLEKEETKKQKKLWTDSYTRLKISNELNELNELNTELALK